MLTKGAVKLDIPGVSVVGFEPPVMPGVYGLKWWTGETAKTKPDGTVDRSATLFGIAGQLARAGNSEDVIGGALLDRDAALGFQKYTDRPDHQAPDFATSW